MTCGGLSPDPKGLQRIAAGTGVHLVMGCGYYVNDYQDPRNHDRTVDDAPMIGQILDGAWNTDVCAGMIGEIGWPGRRGPTRRSVMQGAQSRRGNRSVDQRSSRPRSRSAAGSRRVCPGPGFLTDRIVISHIDRTIFDEPRLLKLADSGVTIEFDLFGQEASYYGAWTSTCPTMRRGST